MGSTQQKNKYLGLLECPLRRGFIEFEYHSGDLVSELQAKVIEVWGSAEEETRAQLVWYYGWKNEGIWVILCQDKGGAYVPLKGSERIPLKPPPSIKKDIMPASYTERVRSQSHPRLQQNKMTKDIRGLFGLSNLEDPEDLDDVTEGSIYESDVIIADLNKKHLLVPLNRHYKLPGHQKYSIKLMALLGISGG